MGILNDGTSTENIVSWIHSFVKTRFIINFIYSAYFSELFMYIICNLRTFLHCLLYICALFIISIFSSRYFIVLWTV